MELEQINLQEWKNFSLFFSLFFAIDQEERHIETENLERKGWAH
jgi:hypothetical protein